MWLAWKRTGIKRFLQLTLLLTILAPHPQNCTADRLEIVAQQGDQASSSSGPAQITYFNSGAGVSAFPVINENGEVATQARVLGPIDRDTALIRIRPDLSKQIIAREGDDSPIAGTKFSSFGPPLLNSASQLISYGSIIGAGVTPSNNNVLWHFIDLGTFPLMRMGAPAPGTLGTFSIIQSRIVSNQFQDRWASFIIGLSGAGLTAFNNNAVFTLEAATDLTSLAVSGRPAPQTASYFNVPRSTRNRFGDEIVFSQLTNSTGTLQEGQGIWRKETFHNNLILEITSGNVAPGVSDGRSLISLFQNLADPKINSAGQIAFSGQLNASTNSPSGNGIFVISGETITPALLPGDPMPYFGFSNEISLGPSPINSRNSFSLCDNGDLVVTDLLRGPDTHSGNDRAIVQLHTLPGGGYEVLPILRGGMQVPDQPAGTLIKNSSVNASTWVSSNCDAYFWIELAGANVLPGTEMILLRWSQGQLQTVIRNRDLIPGLANKRLAQAGTTQITLYVNGLGQAIVLAGVLDELTGSATGFALWRVDEHGEVLGYGTEFGPLALTDGSAPVVNDFVFDRNSFNDRGEFVLNTQIISPALGSVLIVGKIESAPQCEADVNGDASITVQDLFEFLNRWFALSSAADINSSGDVTIQDLFEFLEIWLAGC